ncbi:NTPase family protein [Cotonvirus japonicus]|uniref:NTPase family protein n=1 Tax=Cotonvirus japonicus TaxID=2811091 RepID=A0ABM7NRX3_9VIRU|nr:NTPase family protein [Cotonvirus japonicus]BCS82899.1 NTPase family protein [Cotonvirus japonicus]
MDNNAKSITNNTGTSNSNVVMSPDYGQLMDIGTNTAIVKEFLRILFSSRNKLNFTTLSGLFTKMIIIVIIKMCIEDSKKYLDKFTLTNLNSIKFMIQKLRYSHITYDIVLINDKWVYETTNMSINTLTSLFEQRQIIIGNPGNYYYHHRSFIIKVSVQTDKISFIVPDINSCINHITTDIIYKNREILFGGKTIMQKVNVVGTTVIKLEPVSISNSYATKIYLKLEKSIRNHFYIDKVMKLQSIPFCVNFNGKPGTGKTTFGSYIAGTGIFDRIIIFNLVQSTENNLQETLTKLENQLNSNTGMATKNKSVECSERILIIFDEIDKWLESYMNNQIHKMREQARSSKQQSDNKTAKTITEEFQKLTPEEEDEKKIQLKNTFLDQLYKLVDGHTLQSNRKYVIIFNTNHFEYMFTNVDKRYEALKDRFQIYEFQEINKSEIIDYLRYVNESFLNYVDNDFDAITTGPFNIKKLCISNEKIFDIIPDDFTITYRNLQKILNSNHYNIPKVIESLGNKIKKNILSDECEYNSPINSRTDSGNILEV